MLSAAALYMVITFTLVWVFRRIERRYLRHLDIDSGKTKKAPGKAPAVAAGMPQMR